MSNGEKSCMNCKHFEQTKETIYGKCKLVADCLGETCHKFQWCVSFETKEKSK